MNRFMDLANVEDAVAEFKAGTLDVTSLSIEDMRHLTDGLRRVVGWTRVHRVLYLELSDEFTQRELRRVHTASTRYAEHTGTCCDLAKGDTLTWSGGDLEVLYVEMTADDFYVNTLDLQTGTGHALRIDHDRIVTFRRPIN